MNRVIKYRQPIFDRNTGRFVDWHYWGVGIEQSGEANVGFLTYKMGVTDPKDSQQFTGLLDKNGKEVYEEDVNDNGEVIKWNCLHNCYGWFNKAGMKRYILSEVYDNEGNMTRPYVNDKIIGNTIENPELLQ